MTDKPVPPPAVGPRVFECDDPLGWMCKHCLYPMSNHYGPDYRCERETAASPPASPVAETTGAPAMDALIATTRELDAALFAARARLAEAERDRDAALAAAGAMAAVCEAADRVERGFSRSKSETTVNVYPNGVDALDGFDLFDLLRAALAAWRAGRDPGSEK